MCQAVPYRQSRWAFCVGAVSLLYNHCCGRPMQLEGATAKGRLEYTLDTLDTIVSTTIVILILKVEQKVRQKGTDGFQYI